jgi:hypothetical protein
MEKRERLLLIRGLCADVEPKRILRPLADAAIEEEILLFQAKISPEEAEEFQSYFIKAIFEGIDECS